MILGSRSLQIAVGAFISLAFFSTPLFADIIVERFTKSGGFSGMGASEGQSRESIKGLKKREDSTMKFTGKILGRLAGAKKSSTIYRIDKDLIWDLDHSKKNYRERTVSIPQQETPPGSSGPQGDSSMAEQGKEEQPEVRIVKNEFKVKKTGEKKTINGYPCVQYIITWLIETENIETKERGRNLMTTELWNTPEDKTIKMLKKEEEAFNRAYLKKMGMEMSPVQMKQFGLSILGSVAGAAGKDLKKEMSQIKGYPITSSVKWEAESIETSKKPKAQIEEADEEEGLDLSKGLGGLGGFFKKAIGGSKEKEDRKNPPLFESYTEIKKIEIRSLSDDVFSVPAGYKKLSGD